MSITKLKTIGHWALPTNSKTQDRPLAGRVIFGILTGTEGPDRDANADTVITSAKDRRR